VIALCERCIAGQHWLCQEGGCTCVSASCWDFHPKGRTRYTTNDMAPDGRVRWDHKEQTMDHDDRKARAVKAAHEIANVDYDETASPVQVPLEVLEALTMAAALHKKHAAERAKAEVPIIVTGDAETIAKVGMRKAFGLAENGDPMYQRAKKALEEIHTFRSVNVEHETDIVTTNAIDGTHLATYRSGINEVTITIRGYLR